MELTNISDGENLSVDLLDFGARIAGIHIESLNVACTYSDINSYASDPFYLGASIGPICNRIAAGQLKIGKQTLQMPCNEAANCLHGGGMGFDKQYWQRKRHHSSMAEYHLRFKLDRVGLTGVLSTIARYSVANGALKIEYIATADTTTYINLTNHVYLNLSGHNQPLNDHQFELHAKSFANVDQHNIPTGEVTKIEPPMAYSINTNPAFSEFNGFVDHHFNVADNMHMKRMVRAKSATSGISLLVSSNSPGFQFYTGKFLTEPFAPSSGFCVEPQYAPDAINQTQFFSPLLKKNTVYHQKTILQFAN